MRLDHDLEIWDDDPPGKIGLWVPTPRGLQKGN